MKKLKIFLFILSCTFITAFSYKNLIVEKPNILAIKGHLYYKDEKVKDALVKLYQGNKVVELIHTKKSGKFQFLLFNDINYTLEIEKENFVTERIKVSTKEKTEFGGKYLYEFKVVLMSMQKFKNVDISNLDFPTAIIKYDPKRKEYGHDKEYSKMVKSEIKKLKEEARNTKEK